MKNIQFIDGADNSKYLIYAATDDEFSLIFPSGNDIEFIEDLIDRLGEDNVVKMMGDIFSRSVAKPSVIGIHGTIFYDLIDVKKKFYPTKRFSDDKYGG